LDGLHRRRHLGLLHLFLVGVEKNKQWNLMVFFYDAQKSMDVK
jgi:hypothetical protein